MCIYIHLRSDMIYIELHQIYILFFHFILVGGFSMQINLGC